MFIGLSKLQQCALASSSHSSFLPEVTKILLFAAQASHQLVPPEVSISAVVGDVKKGQEASTGI